MIICNTNICHAITESLITFSWGNDIYHKGLLGLGENIFQMKIPTLNKYLSSSNDTKPFLTRYLVSSNLNTL